MKSLGAKTFLYPTPVLLVGTYDPVGRPNLMAAAWAGICCSSPPCVSVSLRKATHTYGNMMQRREFTLSVPSADQVRLVDYLGMYSGKDRNKFEALGLTEARAGSVEAPYAEQFRLVLECRLLHTLELGLHTMFVGQVLNVLAHESVLDADGKLDVKSLAPIAYAPVLRTYYELGNLLGKAFSVGKNADVERG